MKEYTLKCTLLSFVLGLFILFGLSQVCFCQTETINLMIGQSKTLKFQSIVKEVNIDDLSVVDVEKGDDKTAIQVMARKKGKVKGQVFFYDKDPINYVFNIETGLDQLQKRIKVEFPYLTTRLQDGKVVVEGKFKNDSDKKSFRNKFSQELKTSIIDNASNSAAEIAIICKNINNMFKEAMITNVRAVSYGQKIVIEGSTVSKSQTDRIRSIAERVYPYVQLKLDSGINASDTLNVEVLFIEVERRKDIDVGNKAFQGGHHLTEGTPLFQASTEGGPKVSKVLGSSLQYQVGPMYMFLDLIEKTVVSKIFSHPKLVVRSGHPANFHAGNRIFIQKNIVTNGTVATDYEEVNTGIEISIVPKSDAISRIDNDISIKVSDVKSLEGTPNISVSEIKTAVTIDNGQSILLSGLSLKEDKKSVDKIPLLGSIPLIGELFKFRSKQGSSKEILVILTVSKINTYVRPQELVDSIVQQADSDISFSVID